MQSNSIVQVSRISTSALQAHQVIVDTLPEVFDLSRETLLRTRDVLSIMDSQLKINYTQKEIYCLGFKSLVGAVGGLLYFQKVAPLFVSSQQENPYTGLPVFVAASFAGLALGLRVGMDGLLKTLSFKANIFLQRIRSMKDSSLSNSTGSSCFKNLSNEHLFAPTKKFENLYKFASAATEILGVLSLSYIAVSCLNSSALPALPFVIGTTSYFAFKHYLSPRKQLNERITEVVSVKERIARLKIYIDTKLED